MLQLNLMAGEGVELRDASGQLLGMFFVDRILDPETKLPTLSTRVWLTKSQMKFTRTRYMAPKAVADNLRKLGECQDVVSLQVQRLPHKVPMAASGEDGKRAG